MQLTSEKRLIFVSGKGGVGKSLIAAGLAFEEAKRGRRVLLAEVGNTSYYKDFWNLQHVDHEPSRSPLGFALALWSGESALREYVLHYLKMESLYRLFFENRVTRSLVNVAPGLSEVSIMGKITSGLRKVGPPMNYDLIVVDCFATGHALALFLAAKGMQEAVRFGPMGQQCREMLKILQNPELCSYVLVTLLEELPVVETLEFRDSLKRELGVEAELIGNKVLPLPVSEGDLQKIEGLQDFGDYLLGVHRRQRKFAQELKNLTPHYREVPLIFSNDPDQLVKKTGEALRTV